MPLVLNEEQQLLKDSAQEFFSEKLPVDTIRQLRDSGDVSGFRSDVWKEMSAMGWPAVAIPEEYGGLGFGFVGLGLLLQAAGRNLSPSPLLSTAALGASALLLGGTEQQKQEILPGIASGETVVALAVQEGPVFNPKNIACEAVATERGFSISGEKSFVADGNIADQLVVVARTSGEPGKRNGISLFIVNTDEQGVSIQPQVMVDTRSMASISLDNVQLDETALLGEKDNGFSLLEQIIDRGNIALSAEMLGSVEQAFETTLEYLKTREQFGQPIGAFQALQHRAAQMFCEIEIAKSLVLRALNAVDEEGFDIPYMASSAKVHMCDTYRLVSNEGIQMHGGMGMTDELDIGLYIKRARVVMQLLGDENFHVQRYASMRGY
jgi:alkylation response protein AidB-like acyl-CoA dehydrogenase